MSTKSSTSNSSSNSKNTDKQQIPQKAKVWNQCSGCRLVIQKHANEEHVCCSEPASLAALLDAGEGKNADQGFLFDGQLVGCLLAEHDKDLVKDLPIDRELLFDFAFVNAQTASLAGFRIGDCLWIARTLLDSSTPVVSFPAVCWPTSGVDQTTVALGKHYRALNGLRASGAEEARVVTTVRRVDETAIRVATRVTLELNRALSSGPVVDLFAAEDESSSSEKELVLAFLKEKYRGKCLFERDHSLSLNYMGQRLVFAVKDVQSTPSGSARKPTAVSVEALASRVASELTIDAGKKGFVEAGVRPSQALPSSLSCPSVFRVDAKTELVFAEEAQEKQAAPDSAPTVAYSFESIGGLGKELDVLRELFILPFEFESLYKEIGVDFGKGVLLYGPSGCGKTLVARTVAHLSKASVVELSISQVFSKNYGESESRLRKVFQEAWRKSPCIMLIDEIDTLCSRREAMSQDLEKRLVSLFTSLVDQSKTRSVLFLATTNKIDAIDLALRRPGRLDKEIEIPIPNQTARYSILKSRLALVKSELGHEELLEIAQNCHGYVGADLDMLVQEAALVCVRRLMMGASTSQTGSVTVADLKAAMHAVKPSAMREITFDIPKVYWNQIGGQHELKKKLHQAIIWPIKYAESFKRLSVKPPRGLLMYGPPGCSKTMIAKALATETGLNFIAVKGPELFSKWVGESERTVREIFRKARNAAPAIIFFDEIDAVAMERSSSANKSNNVGDRVLAQLLNEMDGVESLTDVTIVAATNRPDMIDKALMRPGRLDRIVYVRLPDAATRREIFELKFRTMPVADDVDMERLVADTDKYSGAEIAAVCNEAAFLALDVDIESTRVSMRDLSEALRVVTPRTSDETIRYFDNFSFNSGLSEI